MENITQMIVECRTNFESEAIENDETHNGTQCSSPWNLMFIFFFLVLFEKVCHYMYVHVDLKFWSYRMYTVASNA